MSNTMYNVTVNGYTGKIGIFSRIGNIDDMLSLQQELIDSKLFKKPVTGVNGKKAISKDSDITKQDVCIAESNVSDFLTIWARHERKGKKTTEPASYGIRIKTGLDNVPSIKALLGNIGTSFNDNHEYRISVFSPEDVKTMVIKILQYSQAYALKKQVKEVTEKAVTAI